MPCGRQANATFGSEKGRKCPARWRLRAPSTTCKNLRKQREAKGRGEAGGRRARGQRPWPSSELRDEMGQHRRLTAAQKVLRGRGMKSLLLAGPGCYCCLTGALSAQHAQSGAVTASLSSPRQRKSQRDGSERAANSRLAPEEQQPPTGARDPDICLRLTRKARSNPFLVLNVIKPNRCCTELTTRSPSSQSGNS